MNQIEKIYEGESFILDLSNPNKVSKQLKEMLSGIFSTTGVSRAYLNERTTKEETTDTKEAPTKQLDYIDRKVELVNHEKYRDGLKGTIKGQVQGGKWLIILNDGDTTLATKNQLKLVEEAFDVKSIEELGYDKTLGSYTIEFGENEIVVTYDKNEFIGELIFIPYAEEDFKILIKCWMNDKDLAIKVIIEEAIEIYSKKRENNLVQQLQEARNQTNVQVKKVENVWNEMLYKYEEKEMKKSNLIIDGFHKHKEYDWINR